MASVARRPKLVRLDSLWTAPVEEPEPDPAAVKADSPDAHSRVVVGDPIAETGGQPVPEAKPGEKGIRAKLGRLGNIIIPASDPDQAEIQRLIDKAYETLGGRRP